MSAITKVNPQTLKFSIGNYAVVLAETAAQDLNLMHQVGEELAKQLYIKAPLIQITPLPGTRKSTLITVTATPPRVLVTGGNEKADEPASAKAKE